MCQWFIIILEFITQKICWNKIKKNRNKHHGNKDKASEKIKQHNLCKDNRFTAKGEFD